MRSLLFAAVVLCCACAARRAVVSLPEARDNQTPGWVDLRPGMELGIEAAYYSEGVTRAGLAGYLGAESATYEIGPTGSLGLASTRSFVDEKAGKTQPRDQPAVEALMRGSSRSARYHRLFFQVVMSRNDKTKPAVLLSARSAQALERITRQFAANLYSSCTGLRSNECIAFPDLCTASLQIVVKVNGVTRKVVWGSSVSSVAGGAHAAKVTRYVHGQIEVLPVDLADAAESRLRLFHGDEVQWD